MEGLLRQRPPPDRYHPHDPSPEAIATGKIVKYKEKKPKKGDKAEKTPKEGKAAKKAKKESGAVVSVTQPESQQAIVVQPSEPKAPVLVVPPKAKEKKALKASKLSVETPSAVMPTATASSSKRKRDGKEKSSKSKKKSRHHDVKSRGRSRSRGPARYHGKRARSLSPSSESDVKTSDSEISSDESSDSTDSEEEARRRRRARSKSRGRQRARSRARSRSRARDSSDESGSESSDEEDEENPIFMAFSVPGGKIHMRPIKKGTSYPKLLDTIYALSNINQKIPLELAYVMKGMTLQLSDEEDFKALLEAATYTGEMVQVKVARVEEKKSLPLSQQAVAATPITTAATIPDPVVNADPEKPDRMARREQEKARKKEKAQLIKQNDPAPVTQAAVNGSPSKEAVTANDSIVSLESSEDIPLAKVVFKGAAGDAKKKKEKKVDVPVSAAAVLPNGEGEAAAVPEKSKRSRRTKVQIEADKLAKVAQMEAIKAEKQEQKAAKRAEVRKELQNRRDATVAAAAAEATEKSTLVTGGKNETVVTVDIPPQTPAAKAVEPSSVKAAEATPTDKPVEETTKDKADSSTPKKKRKTAKKSAEDSEPVAQDVVEPPSATPKKQSKKAAKAANSETGETSPVKDSEGPKEPPAKEPKAVEKSASSPKKAAKSNGVAEADKGETASPASKKRKQSVEKDCAICFEKGHSKPYCPIITGGRETVQKRYDELKAKKHKKTKVENDACKILEGWLKTEKDHQEQELRFSQKGTVLYRRGGYASEAERLEDEEEQRVMTEALEQERERIQAQGHNNRASASLSPGKGRTQIYDISDKIRRDRERMVARGSEDPLVVVPAKQTGSPAKMVQSSPEADQLASSQVTSPDEQSRLLPVSPTLSESELATSPMLMAGQYKPNGDMQDVTLPSTVIEEETLDATEQKSDGSSDTSDDSSGDSDDEKGEQDEIAEEAESRKEPERSESIASSNDDGKKDKAESEELDEIEATPVQAKPTSKNSWVASIGNLVGFGGSSQTSSDSYTPASSKTAIQAPPSGQQMRQIQGTPVMSSTPVNRRGRPPVGGARLSQLDTSALKSSYSQPNTPRHGGASPASKKATSPSKRNIEDMSDSDSHGDSSDSDHDAEIGGKSMPKAKLAGKKQSKPRASLLAKFGTA